MNVQERYAQLAGRQGAAAYNFDHFAARHLAADATGVARLRGIRPGEEAPDFDLPLAGGGRVRLSALRGRPVLLRFGSFT